MSERDLKLIEHIMAELKCIHPFRISRILLLSDWKSEERLGEKLTEKLTYRGAGYGFYIEELKPLIEKLEKEGRVRKIEERKCIEYLGEKPELPSKWKGILDEVIEETRNLGEDELNRLVIRDPRYSEVLEEG